MTENELFERVIKYVGEFLETDVSHLNMESRLVTALPGLDSMRMFEMFLYLEDCFGTEFDDSLIENLDSMGDLVQYVESQVAKGAASPKGLGGT